MIRSKVVIVERKERHESDYDYPKRREERKDGMPGTRDKKEAQLSVSSDAFDISRGNIGVRTRGRTALHAGPFICGGIKVR